MDWLTLTALVLAVGLGGYLIASLLMPERFS